MRKKYGAILLSLVMMLSAIAGTHILAEAAEAVPLKLVIDETGDKFQVTVLSKDELVLSNYDVQLSWDASAFSLNEITNGQAYLFGNFQQNTDTGKISAASSGNNVTVSAGETLATYVLSPLSGALDGTYSFTLTVRDAADEDGYALSWKGGAITESLELGKEESMPLKL